MSGIYLQFFTFRDTVLHRQGYNFFTDRDTVISLSGIQLIHSQGYSQAFLTDPADPLWIDQSTPFHPFRCSSTMGARCTLTEATEMTRWDRATMVRYWVRKTRKKSGKKLMLTFAYHTTTVPGLNFISVITMLCAKDCCMCATHLFVCPPTKLSDEKELFLLCLSTN